MNGLFCYFDAVFFIQKNEKPLPSFLFSEVLITPNHNLDESKSIVRKLTLTNNEVGESDYKKAKKIILKKAKREGFQKVLVLNHILENHPESFQEHINFIIDEMQHQKWKYWQIESLSDSTLTSAFKESDSQESELFFAYAFNLKNNK